MFLVVNVERAIVSSHPYFKACERSAGNGSEGATGETECNLSPWVREEGVDIVEDLAGEGGEFREGATGTS